MLPAREVIMNGAILMALAYGLGSLPFSVWIGRLFFGTDVREYGSGNAGATNTWRVLGWKAGLPVLILDIAKGFASTYLPLLGSSLANHPDAVPWLRTGCGIVAAIGHIYPVFAGFHGGKAVATLLGVVLGLMPLAAAGSLVVFILTLLLSRMVSLGSVLAAISLPLIRWLVPGTDHPSLLLFSVLITILIILTHLRNIQRIFRGEESRIRFRDR
jgi:glycerol-3-phosphate acyltransferase PlsY